MLNYWFVEYVTKYTMKAPDTFKCMKEVLRQSVDEVCDLIRKSLKHVHAKTLRGRDYGIFETVHLGLGLPLVYPLMAVSV